MKKRIIAMLLCFCFVVSLCGCSDQNAEPQAQTTTAEATTVESQSETAKTTEKEPETQPTDAPTTDAQTTTQEPQTEASSKTTELTVATPEETTKAQTSATTAVTQPPITTTTEKTTEKIEVSAPVDFYKVVEAEDAVLKGSLSVVNSSGAKVVENFDGDDDSVEFTVDFPADGLYKFTIKSCALGPDKLNNFLIDNEAVGTFSSKPGSMNDYVLDNILVMKGTHKIKITKSWGWIQLDKIIIEAAEGVDESIFDTPTELINKNSTAETKALFKYLTESYGNVTLSGQYYGGNTVTNELEIIEDITGKYPAIIGLDLMDYTPSRVALGASSTRNIEEAIEYDQKGGIVTMCWHWNAPTEYLYSGTDGDTGNPRWWGGFYTRNSSFDIEKVMNGQDDKGLALLDRDIEKIAECLNKLEEKGVPVLWRPLHEASGGWFWWGAKGPEAFKKLWIYLYDKLTNTYGCNNLIWVWNGQHKDWYPGDNYVDIVGEDIYPGNRVYSPQTPKFCEVADYSNENKIVALTENGCLFDVDLAYISGAKWAWFSTWCSDFVVKNGKYSEAFTEKSVLIEVYNHEKVITLDELPDF